MSAKKFIITGAFPEPEWTQVPNKFFDMLPEMEASEALTTLVLIRETYGYHRPACTMSISKLAGAAGISEGSVKTGAEMAEKRGTFRRVNADKKTSAEWELITGSTIDPLTIEGGEGQPLMVAGSTIDPQVSVKEIKETIKEKDIIDGILIAENTNNIFTHEEQNQIKSKMDYILKNEGVGQVEQAALLAFEDALNTPASWSWYPAKTSDAPAWEVLRAFVVKTYAADARAFHKYADWRGEKYARGAMSNLAIKRAPAEFELSYSDFLASSSMYGNNKQISPTADDIK